MDSQRTTGERRVTGTLLLAATAAAAAKATRS